MVGFGTTKLTRVWEPALLWNQLHSEPGTECDLTPTDLKRLVWLHGI